MAWFTLAFTKVLPFVVDAFESRDVKLAGEKMFGGIAAALKQAAGDPGKVRELADTLEAKKGELTGAIVAKTPAAQFMAPEYMPPDALEEK